MISPILKKTRDITNKISENKTKNIINTLLINYIKHDISNNLITNIDNWNEFIKYRSVKYLLNIKEFIPRYELVYNVVPLIVNDGFFTMNNNINDIEVIIFFVISKYSCYIIFNKDIYKIYNGNPHIFFTQICNDLQRTKINPKFDFLFYYFEDEKELFTLSSIMSNNMADKFKKLLVKEHLKKLGHQDNLRNTISDIFIDKNNKNNLENKEDKENKSKEDKNHLFKKYDIDVCLICFDKLEDNIVYVESTNKPIWEYRNHQDSILNYISTDIKLECGHLFHEDCIKEWLKQRTNNFIYNGILMENYLSQKTCPMCKNHIIRLIKI
jgi:hypothetical protein